jgi:glycosyltransferase involved in cell wall biosynthesis
MSRLRVLILALEANPDGITGSLIGYCQAEALGRLHDVTLMIRPSREAPVRRKQGAIRSVEVIRVAWLERFLAWTIHRVFKDNYYSQALQAFTYPFGIVFEWQAWHQMRTRILAGEFDVVLRLLPVSAVRPSPFAFFLRNGPIPFVIGPVNGGLPWPPGFAQAKKSKQWIAGLRVLYRFMPFARSTYTRAAAIIAGSSHSYAEFAAFREKMFFLPENGVDRSRCSRGASSLRAAKLELIFLGSLIPLKACDLAVRGSASLLKEDLAHLTIVGDGPERQRLEELTRSLGVDKAVSFYGFLKHDAAMQRLRSSDILVFPSVRDFGGGVVFEALSLGVVPIVADFGGPGDVVQPEVGCKVRLTNEADVVLQIEQILRSFAQDRDRLERLKEQAVAYAIDYLSWDAKAQAITSIMRWALRQGAKPNLPPPKMLELEHAK